MEYKTISDDTTGWTGAGTTGQMLQNWKVADDTTSKLGFGTRVVYFERLVLQSQVSNSLYC
jgi:hypothetical protein